MAGCSSFINPSFFAGQFLQTVDVYTGKVHHVRGRTRWSLFVRMPEFWFRQVANLLNYPMRYCFYPERRRSALYSHDSTMYSHDSAMAFLRCNESRLFRLPHEAQFAGRRLHEADGPPA
jgi:hypothetical protein